MKKTIASCLSKIDKPLRYIDHELNAFHKDFEEAKTRFCFVYPDIYEIGISHLGLKILYTIINNHPEAMSDRAYTPWTDLGELLFKDKIPLSAIESKRDLKEFDCIGFTLQTELIYTNILYTLDLAQIPLRCENRTEEHPIILAGGINAVNPHPLSLFIDAFFIGEAEEGILQINDIFLKDKDRKKRLELLSELDFVYVSPFAKGGTSAFPTIARHIQKYTHFSHSESTHYPQLVPLLEGTHNRYTAEIMRGCTRGCRFCQAGMFYRPTREKDPQIVLNQLFEDTIKSGWNSCGLMSLSSSDYSQIKLLLNELVTRLKDTGVSLSLPSLRIDSIDSNLAELMNQLKKSGITLAIEAGTQRLRDTINKNITEKDIFSAVQYSIEAEVKLIKLYFMVGLPFETDEDIVGIVSLIEKIVNVTHRKMRINVSISPFVPKPFTPFQWAKMDDEDIVLNKVLKIKYALQKYKIVKINYHTIELSFLEAVLSRGDIETGYVIERAYQNGAKFDSWREYFDYSIWKNAANDLGFDWYKPINGYEIDDLLPWDNIDIGISKEFLKKEYQNAEKGVTTPDCRETGCTLCGACDVRQDLCGTDKCVPYRGGTDKCVPYGGGTDKSVVFKPQTPNPKLYRVYFSKINDLKYLSHLDFLRLLHRLLMLSGLPISFSQGFNPHPRTSFCPPLSSGIEGENEFFDIWLNEHRDANTILEGLSKTKLTDLNFHKVELLFENDKYKHNYIPISKIENEVLSVEFSKDIDLYVDRLDCYLSGNDTIIERERKGKTQFIDLKNSIHKIYFHDDKLLIIKRIQGASIFDILKKVFDINRENIDFLRIVRIGFD